VDSTRADRVFVDGDHEGLLSAAIADRTTTPGRCHSCHDEGGDKPVKDPDILAFAPLPTLALGVAVREPEISALAPARALRGNMIALGTAGIALFVLFTWLSVRSVVSPVTRLTDAVSTLERAENSVSLPGFGHDEIGQLAGAFETWHGRTLASLEQVRRHRGHLRRELLAREQERRGIARDVHDTLAQDLAAMRLALERLVRTGECPVLRERLEELQGRTSDMLAAVRTILLDLRPTALEEMGFLPALQWRLELMTRDSGVRGTLTMDGDEVDLGFDTSVTLYRIFQEASKNAIQHGAATHLFVTFEFQRDAVQMTIEDDGCGFDPDRWPREAANELGCGFGLLGMEERAELLGGSLTLMSAPGEGTLVRVRVPIAPPQEAS